MNTIDIILLVMYILNIIKLPYVEATKFDVFGGWLCAILMLLRIYN